MNSKTLIRKAISLCLMVAVYGTYSMTAMAASEKIAGELLVSGKTANVKVNGEVAQSGRTIFSASTISTSEDANAVINLGKLGTIELAPNTTANIAFNENGISGDLVSGKVTVLGADKLVNIKTAEGETLKLSAGQSATSGKATKGGAQNGASSPAWWVWVAIFGGAVAGIAIAATTDNNRVALGGGTTVVSPNR